jgi:hypothetical protein
MNVRELRAHAEELGFTPQEAVRWLAPRELARTAVKVALAGVFAGYADKREIQGALGEELLRAPTGDPTSNELWFDYVADLGDGFDATASVAWMLGTEKLTVDTPGPFQGRLTRGSLLVLGGDEVYPVASTTAYEDRMKGPYRSALPHADDQPLMLALPGNHDWYDGLTAFLRVFAQQRSIGGWRTRQTRSYFAVGLPQRWWLVGLDSQLGSYFDDPQLRYFEKHLSSNLQPGDGVIVCCAAPTWVKSADGDVDAFNALHWFDRNIVRTRVVDHETGERAATGASIRLWLTGDKHHYARFAERLPGDPGGETSGDPTTDVDLPPDPRRQGRPAAGLRAGAADLPHGGGVAPPRPAHHVAVVAELVAPAQPRLPHGGGARARRPVPRGVGGLRARRREAQPGCCHPYGRRRRPGVLRSRAPRPRRAAVRLRPGAPPGPEA